MGTRSQRRGWPSRSFTPTSEPHQGNLLCRRDEVVVTAKLTAKEVDYIQRPWTSVEMQAAGLRLCTSVDLARRPEPDYGTDALSSGGAERGPAGVAPRAPPGDRSGSDEGAGGTDGSSQPPYRSGGGRLLLPHLPQPASCADVPPSCPRCRGVGSGARLHLPLAPQRRRHRVGGLGSGGFHDVAVGVGGDPDARMPERFAHHLQRHPHGQEQAGR